MRPRTASRAGVGIAALVLTTVATGAVTASGSTASHVSPHAAGVAASPGARAAAKPMGVSPAGACQSRFGSELPARDGIISWNDTSSSGIDTAGAAEVNCLHSRRIALVRAFGYFGTAPKDTFHVTFYANDSTGGSDEPDDTTVLCEYPHLTGAAGGQYPTPVKTVLSLHPVCRLPAGPNWVSIQNVDSAGPWYWEMQTERTGASPDWVDRNDSFSDCTTYDDNRYLVDCMGFDYGGWMLSLRGARHP